MTPTLTQCRELERLYPGAWENTEKVCCRSEIDAKQESPVIEIRRSELAEYDKAHNIYCDDEGSLWIVIAPAPSLGEMVRVIQGQNIEYQMRFNNIFVHRTKQFITLEVSADIVIEEDLAQRMINAQAMIGANSQHREYPEGKNGV